MARVPDLMRSWRAFRSWPRPARWASYTAVVVVLLMVASLVAGVVVVRTSWPQTDGEIAVPGLDGRVRVVRDDHGIPQIYADTTDDLFRAQGFVARAGPLLRDGRTPARDGRPRSRSCSARTASRPTSSSAPSGWRRVAEEELRLLDADTRAALQAYADGVNAYLEDASPRDLSLEYTVLALGGLDYTPEEWTPVDSLAWLKAMAWDLRGNMDDEIGRVLAAVDHTARAGRRALPRLPLRRAPSRSSRRARSSTGASSRRPTGPGTRNPARPPYTADQVQALGRPPGRPRRDARAARPRRRPGQQQLGRRRRAHRHRQAAARERPAPRHQPARHLVPDRPALQRGLRRLPVRRRGVHASPACRAW